MVSPDIYSEKLLHNIRRSYQLTDILFKLKNSANMHTLTLLCSKLEIIRVSCFFRSMSSSSVTQTLSFCLAKCQIPQNYCIRISSVCYCEVMCDSHLQWILTIIQQIHFSLNYINLLKYITQAHPLFMMKCSQAVNTKKCLQCVSS